MKDELNLLSDLKIIKEFFTRSLLPEEKLVCAIIAQALKDNDVDYIYRGGLEMHCQLLNLNHEIVQREYRRQLKSCTE